MALRSTTSRTLLAVGGLLALGALGWVALGSVAVTDSIPDPAPQASATTAPAADTADPPAPQGHAAFLGGSAGLGVYDATGVPVLGGVSWILDTGATTRSAPIVVGDAVLIGGGDNAVWSIGTDGMVRWRHEMTAPIDAAVAAAGSSEGLILVAADQLGLVVGLEPSGARIWEQDLSSRVSATPLVADDLGLVVIATAAGELYGLDAPTGEIRWRYPEALDYRARGSYEHGPVLSNDLLYATGNGRLVAVDPGTGAEVCGTRAPARGSAPAAANGSFVYSPVGRSIHVMKEGTCGLRKTGGLAAIPMIVQTVTSPAIVDDTMYIGSGLLIVGFDLNTGADTFTAVVTGDRIVGSPVVAGDVVYAGSADHHLYAVNRHTGEVLWSHDTGGSVAAPAAVIDGAVFVLNADGVLTALLPAPSE